MHSAVTAEMASRVAAQLRAEWPQHTAKNAARTFGVEERTAKSWLAGVLPQNRCLAAMAQRFGWAFTAWIYEPVCGTPAAMAKLEADLAQQRAKVAQMEAAWREMARAEGVTLESPHG